MGEKAVLKIPMPCINWDKGCVIKKNKVEREKHEKVCKYRMFLCPFNKCDETTEIGELINHFEKRHVKYIKAISLAHRFQLEVVKEFYENEQNWYPIHIKQEDKNFFCFMRRNVYGNWFFWVYVEAEE